MDEKKQEQQIDPQFLLQLIGKSEVEKELLRMQIQSLQEKLNENNQDNTASVVDDNRATDS